MPRIKEVGCWVLYFSGTILETLNFKLQVWNFFQIKKKSMLFTLWITTQLTLKSIIVCYSVAKLCLTFSNPMDCSTPGFPVFHHLLEFKFMSMEWVMPSSHLILLPFSFCFQSSLALGSLSMSNHVAKVLELQLQASVLPMNIHQIFKTDWFDLSAVQGTPRVFSRTTILNHQFFGTQVFFMVQFSHPYLTTGKTTALTIRTFVGKEMSLFLI